MADNKMEGYVGVARLGADNALQRLIDLKDLDSPYMGKLMVICTKLKELQEDIENERDPLAGVIPVGTAIPPVPIIPD